MAWRLRFVFSVGGVPAGERPESLWSDTLDNWPGFAAICTVAFLAGIC